MLEQVSVLFFRIELWFEFRLELCFGTSCAVSPGFLGLEVLFERESVEPSQSFSKLFKRSSVG